MANYEYTNDFRAPCQQSIRNGTENDGSGIKDFPMKTEILRFLKNPGLDGQMEHPGDNKKTTWHFDNMGRPTDVLDADGFCK